MSEFARQPSRASGDRLAIVTSGIGESNILSSIEISKQSRPMRTFEGDLWTHRLKVEVSSVPSN